MIELSQKQFGKLVVIGKHFKNKHGHITWYCKCDCGNFKVVDGYKLRQGHTKSCGCLRSEMGRLPRWHPSGEQSATYIHGHARNGQTTPEFICWQNMIRRCTYPRVVGFKYWGGKGVSVCERWMSFSNFLADMGPKPHGDYSIDRIDGNGNYEPSNCRWATRLEQNRNRSKHIE